MFNLSPGPSFPLSSLSQHPHSLVYVPITHFLPFVEAFPMDVFYSNRAAAHIKNNAWRLALSDCNQALSLVCYYPLFFVLVSTLCSPVDGPRGCFESLFSTSFSSHHLSSA